MRESQSKGRLRLRHLMEVTEAKAEELEQVRPRFERLARNESAPRVVSSFNLFPTPPALADKVALLADLKGRILEPSAGLGALMNAARKITNSHITLVEISPDCCRELYTITANDPDCTLIQGDFLGCDSERLGLFDRILMNPPFAMGADIKHILHARELLAPGGLIVSICASGPKQRKALEPIASQWIDLPSGSFKSQGTNVETAIVVIDSDE